LGQKLFEVAFVDSATKLSSTRMPTGTGRIFSVITIVLNRLAGLGAIGGHGGNGQLHSLTLMLADGLAREAI
jgi:hypothetical protein